MATADEFTGIRLVAMLAVTRSGLPLDRFSRLVSPSEAAKLLSPPSVKTRDVAAEGKAEGEKEDDVHTYAEYFHGDQATKFYFDTERYYNEEPTADVHAGYLEEVHRAMQTIVDVLAEVQPDVAYHVAQRHGGVSKGRYKLSFRTFVDGVSVVYHEILRIMQRHPVLRCTLHLWDATVYKASEQLLCAINGRKSDKDRRVLTPIPWMSAADVDAGVDVDVLHYVASHVDPEWPGPMRCPDDVGSEGHSNADVDAYVGEGGVADPRILALVALLGEATASDRPMWLNVAIFLKVADGGGDAYLEAWLDFSAKCKDPHKYYGVSDCMKTWKSLLKKKGGAGGSGGAGGRGGGAGRRGGAGAGGKELTIGTIRHYARCDDPVGYAAWCAEAGFQGLSLSGGTGGGDAEPVADDKRVALLEALRARFPDALGALGEASFVVKRAGNGAVAFEDASVGENGVSGTVSSDFTVCILSSEEGSSDRFIGLLFADVAVKGPLSHLSATIPSDADFVLNRVQKDRATLRSVTPNVEAMITQFHRGDEDEFLKVDVPGKRSATVKTSKPLACFNKRVDTAIADHAITNGMGWFVNYGIVNNNNTSITIIGDDPTEFDHLRVKLLGHATSRRHMKANGYVYEPVEGCPCAFKPTLKYEDYINIVLEDDPTYLSNPRRFDDVMKFMQSYRVKEMPEFAPDRDLLSFDNGVLSISTLEFTPYSAVTPGTPMFSRVARHHIGSPYTGGATTPLLDAILTAQFEPDVAEVLCALVARLLVPIGKLDRWEVMPFLVGVGGTGKSVILSIVDKLFAPGAVGNLAHRREEVFGLESLMDKEVVIGRDMPAALSKSLPQEIVQAMTSGEGMAVARKNLGAVNVNWSAPVIMASNHLPDYVNTGNNVPRRLVTLRFDTVVTNPQEDLLDQIAATELPNIVARCLRAYHGLRTRAKEVGGFWKAVPPKLLEWRNVLAASTNKLHEFLAMDDDERGFSITRVEGHVTWELDLQKLFEGALGGKYVADASVFTQFGFTRGAKAEYACLGCKQAAKARGGKCCEAYSHSNRRQKVLIYNMKVTRGRGPPTEDE